MARKRKAVDGGSTAQRRGRSSGATDAATSTATAKSGSAMSSCDIRPKRNPRRAAKDRWEEHKLMTSDTSALIGLDLVKLLARPEAWDCLEEAEKEEILELLPADVHPNRSADDPDAKIPPLPESFLRYSNNWRAGVRQFQTDLQLGRYDPEWLRQAEEASSQRAAGNFDKFKENEFEQFWGQKQKIDKRLTAGQSSQVKLGTLIENGVIREDDVWKYSRAFSKGKNKILVEKEARISKINGSKLTFVIAPGQRVFLHVVATPTKKTSSIPTSLSDQDDRQIGVTADQDPLGTNQTRTSDVYDAVEAGPHRPCRSPNKKRGRTPDNDGHNDHPMSPEAETSNETQPPASSKLDNHYVTKDTEDCRLAVEKTTTASIVVEDKILKTNCANHGEFTTSYENQPHESVPGLEPQEAEEIIVPDVLSPSSLSAKILEVDGRIKDAPIASAWKQYRCFRDNQDMGSLWEIRQAWYLKNT